MNQNYKIPKTEVFIGVSPNPNEIYTHSTIKLYCSKNNNMMIQMHFVVEWKRVGMGIQQIITNHQNSNYQCSPLDLGYFIQAKIKYQDQGTENQQIRKFGPIKLEPQMLNQLQRSTGLEYLHVKVMVQKITLEIVIKISDIGLTFLSKQNFEFNMKVDSLSDIQIKMELKIIALKLKQYSETITKYIAVITKKQLKNKIQSLDILFQSRSKRDYFILMIKKMLYRKSSTPVTYYHRQQNYIKGRQTSCSNNHVIGSRPRISSQANQLSISRKKVQKKQSIKKQKSINQQTSILKDLESQGLFKQFTQKKQDALNLRDSFNILEEKYLKAKIQMQQQATKDESIDEIKGQLEEARKVIKKLTYDIEVLKEENMILKQHLANPQFCNNKQLQTLRQKIEFLTTQNQRLETERTQIIADKISIQIKYQKQKQQKQTIKQKMQQFTSTPILPKVVNQKKFDFKFPTNMLRSHPSIHMGSQSPKQSPRSQCPKSPIQYSQHQTLSQISPEKRKPMANFKRTDSYISGYRY